MRPMVIRAFPPEGELPRDAEQYLAQVDARYVEDACNSLLIEGYQVTDELVADVAWEDRDPNNLDLGAEPHEVMAAFGYWRAHNVVKRAIRRIIAGESSGRVTREAHREWFLQLFSPSVDAGIVAVEELQAYREYQAMIPGARHVPPPAAAVPALMSTLFDLLENEDSAAVRAVLGHFVFVYIHPYMDGSGRVARLLMNTMLASGGYPWTVLSAQRRDEYLAALESASSDGDIEPFARFIASSL